MTETYRNLKCWAEDDRPREKMIRKGKHNLSDAELLAILIGSGTRTKTAVDLAKDILSSVSNDLNELSKLNLVEIQQHKGIGEAKSITIAAALELSRRRMIASPKRRTKIRSVEDSVHFLKPFFEDLDHERFYVTYLDRANQVIHHECPFVGGYTGVVADGKIIFRQAILFKASAIILAHNHPSGNTEPSMQDKRLTRDLCEFGKSMDIQILDHLIFGHNAYFSFADNELLNAT